MKREVWRCVPDRNGYEVSDLGNVRSIDRIKTVMVNGKVQRRKYKGKVLKPAVYAKSGHLSLPLGKYTNGIPVHQLVLLAFVGPCPKGQEVLHINGDPKDNRLSNLRYGTRSQNIKDAYLMNGYRGRLKPKDVHKIRYLHKTGLKKADIARKLGRSQSCVGNVINGKTFGWVI